MRLLNEYLRERFGCKVYKLALHGASTCPNRDGTCGTGGCIFCSGSGEFAQDGQSVTEQIELAKLRVAQKSKSGRYIAYFQDFTNTYEDPSVLRSRFTEAIGHPDVAVLSVATRPDCLSPEILLLLKELAEIKPVWVELGLQTVHERTARYLRRAYPLSVYDDAVRKLHAVGVEVITHMILGLPGETREDMLETARYIGKSGADGIKLHLLHVLRGTELARDYAAGHFRVMEREEYLSVLTDCLRALPEKLVVHRMTGDGARRDLIAPMWSTDKKAVLNAILQRLRQDGSEKRC